VWDAKKNPLNAETNCGAANRMVQAHDDIREEGGVGVFQHLAGRDLGEKIRKRQKINPFPAAKPRDIPGNVSVLLE